MERGQTIMRHFFAFFILAAVLCGLTSGHAGASSPAPVVTDNAGDHNYEGNTARPVRSYLMAGNGSFMTRVEYTGDRITVESYNETGQILSQQDLAVESKSVRATYPKTKETFLWGIPS